MPTFSPWLSKPIKKPMKNKQEDTKISLCPHCNCMTHTIEGLCGKCMNTKIKPDWEKEFDEEFCKGNEWVAPNMKGSYIKDFIRDLLAKKEAEYEKEKDHIDKLNANALRGIMEEQKKQLKQQHREELIKLNEWIESESGKSGRKEIMEQVTNLLNSQEGK